MVNLDERNLAENKWQQMSETFDFTAEDRVNDAEFNEVIWRAVKGLDSPCPPAVRAAFLATEPMRIKILFSDISPQRSGHSPHVK